MRWLPKRNAAEPVFESRTSGYSGGSFFCAPKTSPGPSRRNSTRGRKDAKARGKGVFVCPSAPLRETRHFSFARGRKPRKIASGRIMTSRRGEEGTARRSRNQAERGQPCLRVYCSPRICTDKAVRAPEISWRDGAIPADCSPEQDQLCALARRLNAACPRFLGGILVQVSSCGFAALSLGVVATLPQPPITSAMPLDSPQRWRSAPVFGRSNSRGSGAVSKTGHAGSGCIAAPGDGPPR